MTHHGEFFRQKSFHIYAWVFSFSPAPEKEIDELNEMWIINDNGIRKDLHPNKQKKLRVWLRFTVTRDLFHFSSAANLWRGTSNMGTNEPKSKQSIQFESKRTALTIMSISNELTLIMSFSNKCTLVMCIFWVLLHPELYKYAMQERKGKIPENKKLWVHVVSHAASRILGFGGDPRGFAGPFVKWPFTFPPEGPPGFLLTKSAVNIDFFTCPEKK